MKRKTRSPKKSPIVPKRPKLSSTKKRWRLISTTCTFNLTGHRHDEKLDEHYTGPCYDLTKEVTKLFEMRGSIPDYIGIAGVGMIETGGK